MLIVPTKLSLCLTDINFWGDLDLYTSSTNILRHFVQLIVNSIVSMADNSFIPICGYCFKSSSSRHGSVLSCGDFLCESCCSQNLDSCPLCSKQFKSLDLSIPDLPEDVLRNVTDSSVQMENLYGAIEFQLKSYKRIIKVLLTERSTNRKYYYSFECE